MKYHNRTFMLVCLIIPVLSLTSCSQMSEMSRLQQAHKSYTHSEYVKDSLKVSTAQRPASTPAMKSSKSLAAIQRQLATQKASSTLHIAATVQKNNLFTATQGLRQQVASLKGKSGYENWLKSHTGLAAVLTVVLKNNLDIQSGLQEAQASLSKYDQVSFLDDTLAQYAAFTKDLVVPVGNKKHSKSVSGGFPFPALLSLKASIIDQSVESSRLQLKQTVQDTLTQTRIAYYGLQLAQQEVGLISRNIQLLESLKKQLKDSYSTSTTELSDILQVDIELEKSRNQRLISRNTLSVQQARLNALLNVSASFTLGRTEKLRAVKVSQVVSALQQQGKQQRVEITRLQSAIKKMQRIIQLSEKRFYPDFSAGYSRFQNKTTQQTGSNATKAAFSTRPSFKQRNFFGTNDAYLQETKLRYKALQAKLSALQNKTEGDIQQAFSGYQTKKSNYRLYQNKLIPSAKTSRDIAKNLFETGDASYSKVIAFEKMILDYRLLSLKAIKEMNVNAAQLARFVGKPVDR